MDVLALHQAGIENVIAVSGTAFTADQGRIIARMARDVTLLFDGDSAGLTAAARGADNLLATDISINVAILPEGHDPDSYILEQGVDALREFLDNPMDFWEFKLQILEKGSDTVEDRIKLAGEVAESISLISDELKRDLYIRDMSMKIGVDINSMRKAVYGRIRKRSNRTLSSLPEKNIGTTSERELLASIISYPHLARRFMEETGSKPFSTPIIKMIADKLFHHIVEGLDISPSNIMSALDDRQAQELVASVAMITLDENTAEHYIVDGIKSHREGEIRTELEKTKQLISIETDMLKRDTYLKRQEELIESIKALKKQG